MDLPAPSLPARLFAGVTDPRVERTRRHLLCDILLIVLCAMLAGAEGFCDIAEWAETKEGWLRTFLDLPGGIPSHDTFERVFRRLDPKELHACFLRWIESLATREDRLIAIDGKTLRRSFDGSGTGRALHVVSAFAANGLGLVLGQVAVDDKSNEITAIPEMLRLLDLKNVVVTIDAMGCHKTIAAQIVSQGATTCSPSKAIILRSTRTWGSSSVTRPPWPRAAPRAPRPSRKTTGASKRVVPWRSLPPLYLVASADWRRGQACKVS